MGFLIEIARLFYRGQVEDGQPVPAKSRGLDANVLMRLAEGHGLLPVLNHVLKSHPEIELSEQFRGLVKYRALMLSMRSLNLTRTLVSLVDHFERAGVAVLPLKGPVFAQEAYGDFALRPSGDVDLLVAPEDRVAAEEVLKEAGAAPEQERNPERHSVWKLDNVLIELHAGCEGDWCPRRVSREIFFRRRRVVDLGPRKVEAFSIEATILYACAHCASHYVSPFVGLEGLKMSLYLDLALLLKRWERELDWVTLIEQSERLTSPLIVRPHLIAAAALFDPPIPAEVKRWLLRDKTSRLMAAEVLRDIAHTSMLQPEGTKGQAARLGKFRRICRMYGNPYRGIAHLARSNWDALFTVSQLDRMAFPNVQNTALLVPLRFYRITSSYVVPLLRRQDEPQ
jgi:hypothetical protein